MIVGSALADLRQRIRQEISDLPTGFRRLRRQRSGWVVSDFQNRGRYGRREDQIQGERMGMFICRDLTQEYFLSLYWDNSLLYVVTKKIADDGELIEQNAVSYTRSAALELLHELSKGIHSFHGLEFHSLDTFAITGRIAEGLKRQTSTPQPAEAKSRISPDMW